MRRLQRGFTLIEILVVLSLLAVLMGLSAGFVQRAGRGNLLLQTCHSLASMMASARAQAFGNARAYIEIEARKDGTAVFRAFRNRQVFSWPCEDLVKTTDSYELKTSGAVQISPANLAGREGRWATFDGGSVSLGDPPWLDFVDGFEIRCRVRPTADAGGLSTQTLFRKGTGLEIKLAPRDAGRMGIEARIRLQKDAKGEGGGEYLLRTGDREGAELPEWGAPLLPGRWFDLRVTYDRNSFTIHVDEKLRGIRTDRRNRMKPNNDRFEIGRGYKGDFDSLVLKGIFEDDNDRFDVSDAVTWLDDKGKPMQGKTHVHFRNRSLDPRYHFEPLRFRFYLEKGDGLGATRIVTVSLSGETFVKFLEE